MGYSPRGRKESDMTEHFHFHFRHVKHGTLDSSLLDQFSSAAQSCLTLCDPVDCSTSGLPVHHQLPEFTHTHVH